MNVFLSSTVFDLIDVRATIERLLRQIGAVPILSDSALSAFDTTPSVNSIETCLLNVDRADAFICVLDRRYGSSLAGAGFEDISATHLEYRRAKTNQVPIHFFVRDRLEADFTVWRRNRTDENLRLPWAQGTRILEFLDEHRTLENQTEYSNWFSVFRDATDLCDVIQLRLQEQILPAQLMDALQTNSMPLFSVKLKSNELNIGNAPSLQLRLECKNIGSSPAFDVETQWSTEDTSHTTPIVAPTESVAPAIIANIASYQDISIDLNLSYETAFGIRVVESHNVGCIFQQGIQMSTLSGTTMNSRRFVRSQRPAITLDER